jgi:hypothetical protein
MSDTDDRKLTLTEMLQLLAAGVMTKDEVREAMGLPKLQPIVWDASINQSIRT